MKNQKIIFLILIFIISNFITDLAFGQYFVKNKINKEEITRNIYKENKVKKITEYRFGDKTEERFVDRNGYVSEIIKFNPIYDFSKDEKITFDTLKNKEKNFFERKIFYKDSLSRDTMITTYNKKNIPYLTEIFKYNPGYTDKILTINDGNYIVVRQTKSDSTGELLDTKSFIFPVDEKDNIVSDDTTKISIYSIESKLNSNLLKKKNRLEYNNTNDEVYVIKIDTSGIEKKSEHVIYDELKNCEYKYKIDSLGVENNYSITYYNKDGQVVKDSFYTKNKISNTVIYDYLPNGLISEYRNININQGTWVSDFTMYEYDKSGKLIKIKKNDLTINYNEEFEYVYEYYE